jgi:hypothetical protein
MVVARWAVLERARPAVIEGWMSERGDADGIFLGDGKATWWLLVEQAMANVPHPPRERICGGPSLRMRDVA